MHIIAKEVFRNLTLDLTTRTFIRLFIARTRDLPIIERRRMARSITPHKTAPLEKTVLTAVVSPMVHAQQVIRAHQAQVASLVASSTYLTCTTLHYSQSSASTLLVCSVSMGWQYLIRAPLILPPPPLNALADSRPITSAWPLLMRL